MKLITSFFLYDSEFDHDCLFCSKRAKQKILLVFDGVDTVSSIWLNGVKVGNTDNMFRRYVSSLGKHISFGHFTAFVIYVLLFSCRISQLEICWKMGKMCWRSDSCLRFFTHFRDIKLIQLTEFLPSVLRMFRRGNVTSISLEKWVSNLNLTHFQVQNNVCSAFDFLAINSKSKYKIKWSLCFV